MKRAIFAAISVLALLAVGGAEAADMVLPVKAAPPIVATPWTGFYWGVDAGARVALSKMSESDSATSINGGPFGPFNPFLDTRPEYGAANFRAGTYFGYNYQITNWVLGLEGEFGYAKNSFTEPHVTILGLTLDGVGDWKTTWDADVRGRVGYLAAPNILIYVAGGPAWQRIEASLNCGPAQFCTGTPAPNGIIFTPVSSGGSFDKLGWTAGAGMEAALWSNWIARAEYRYADYGTVSFPVSASGFSPQALISISQTGNYKVSLQTHTANFGIAYKF